MNSKDIEQANKYRIRLEAYRKLLLPDLTVVLEARMDLHAGSAVYGERKALVVALKQAEKVADLMMREAISVAIKELEGELAKLGVSFDE
ncbi:MAG: hypothetical protein MJK15_00800 [Colwellia sp.]|nr:hypothetical protein [Colwellia sp.]